MIVVVLDVQSRKVFLLRFTSLSRYRIVIAASRLLSAAAACVILVSFAPGHCKPYWSACIKAAIVVCQQIFSSLVFVIFLPLKIH